MKKIKWLQKEFILYSSKIFTFLLIGISISCCLAGCGSKDSENTLIVLNYGKYLEPEVLEKFEEETGIKI